MGQVTITIDKREYAIKCGDGEEAHIIKLSRILDEKARLLNQSVGLINENMMLAMVGLLLADDLEDLKAGKDANVAQAPAPDNGADEKISADINSQIARISSLIKEIKEA
jgi:cell division protein ZapA